MLRKLITPENQNVFIELPQNFVGRQVEVIAFTIDDTMDESMLADKVLTHYASEKSLGKDWLTLEEDKAWQDL